MEKDQRVNKTISIEDAIQCMMKAFNLEKKYREMQVAHFWHEVMGESVSKRTKQVYVHEGKLFVKITSAPLRHEILLIKSKIIAQILTKFGDDVVREIVLL